MKRIIKRILLIVVTFIFLYLVFVNINLHKFINTIANFNFKFIILLICSIILSLVCRAFCFKFLIAKTVKNPSIKELSFLCLTAASLNILLPARAGDIFRAYYTGKIYNADKIKLLGTVMLERLFDIIIIFSFLTIGIFVYQKNPIAEYLLTAAGIILVLSILFAIVTYKFNKTEEICNFIENKTRQFKFFSLIQKSTNFVNNIFNSFCNGFEVIDSPKNAIIALMFSVGIWSFECLSFFIIICGFGYHIHWSVTIFIISFVALACMIPSASIFIGPYQFAVITAFSIYNVSKETALAMTLMEQTVVTIVTSCFAFLYLLKNNISIKDLKKDTSI